MGAGRLAYLPLDENHPAEPANAYGLAKLLCEEVCHLISTQSGMTIVCLRPPAIWRQEDYERIRKRRTEAPDSEWSPFWEYGAFIDVRDLAAAIVRANECPDPGFARLLLCAGDISSSGETSRELVSRLTPHPEWRGGAEYETDPFRALIDTRRARAVLGWSPRHAWADFAAAAGPPQ
jgi:nucleoside-diphosphate-sugar epimerase